MTDFVDTPRFGFARSVVSSLSLNRSFVKDADEVARSSAVHARINESDSELERGRKKEESSEPPVLIANEHLDQEQVLNELRFFASQTPHLLKRCILVLLRQKLSALVLELYLYRSRQ